MRDQAVSAANSSAREGYFWRHAGVVVLLLAGLTAGAICTFLYWRDADEIQKTVLDREIKRTEIFSQFMADDLQDVFANLKLLVDGDGIQDYLVTGKQADLNRALHRAWFMSRLNPNFDQVRFLNEKGQEVIRVNWNGTIVPPGQLQNKADRAYFQKAIGLPPGQFYLSAFDLNVENGKVEQPLKPMERVALPLTDANGKTRGVYVINYLGGNIIAHLENFTPQYAKRLRILNAQGYWLKTADPAEEWGFVLPGGDGHTMARTDPALWAKIRAEASGQVPYRGGYFTWARLSPASIAANSGDVVHADDDFLVIASEISAEEWDGYFSGLRQTFLIVMTILLVLVVAGLWFFRSWLRIQMERDRFFVLTRDLLCLATFDGYFIRLNPAWSLTLGYTLEEMMEHPFIDFVHPDDRERTIAETAGLRKGNETVSFENRYRCKDGSYRWLAWSARPIVADRIIFASARDLTERKRIENEMLSLNDEMKQRADQLEMANKELEAFSYSVSHDLRAPLRHIHGFVEMLQKSPALQAEESSVRYMTVIARAARDMGMLIDDLLAFSRTGRAEMHPRPINMRELIDQVISEMETDNRNRRITWDIRNLPRVRGDAGLLRLVWTNLISNALKYSRQREETRIEIGVLGVADPAVRPNETVFYIRDNGVGFDMKYATKLFGVFQRLHRAEQFEGTGIGLANVQRIIMRHGGRIWADSQPEAGATFFFSMPNTHVPEITHAQDQAHPVGRG